MNKKVLATALIAAGFGTVGLAQEGQEGVEGFGQEAAPAPEGEQLAVLPQFETVDSNADGMIDETESSALQESLEAQQVEFEFASVDSNQDGQIDQQEYVSYDDQLAQELGIA